MLIVLAVDGYATLLERVIGNKIGGISVERISNKNPCLNCCSDRQIGNPDVWQSDCYRCDKLPNWKAKAINRLFDIEDILGDEYDLDRLKEFVEADREGRCVVLSDGSYTDKDGEEALKNAMFILSLTNDGINRYIADAIAEKLVREEAEAALEKMKGGNE